MSFNRNIYRKVLAAATALSMVFAVSSCGESTSWVAKCQDTQINSGIYLFYQTEAMNEATTKLVKENSELDTSDKKLLKTLNIEGTDITSWVNSKAEKQVKIFAGINKKFDELGLELTEDEKASAKNIADMYWQYYSKMYEQNGIGEDSFRQLVEFDSKKEKVFLHYYGEGGEKECDDAQLAAFLEGNYARVKTIKFDLTDSEGNALDNDAKAEVKKLAEEYRKKADNGANFDDLIKEYSDYKAKLAEEAAVTTEAEAAVTAEAEPAEEAAVTTVSGDGSSEETEAVTTAVTESDADAVTEAEASVTEVSGEENAEETTAASEDDDAEVTEVSGEGEEDAEVTTVSGESEKDAEVTTEASEEEKPEETDPYANESIYKKGSEDNGYNPSEKVNNAVFNECVVGGKAVLVEDEENNALYLIQRLDIVDREDLFKDESRTGYLEEMFKDEFDNMASEWADSFGYSVNAAALKRYDPLKIKL